MAGDRRALARLISLAERGGDPAREIARLTARGVRRAHIVGITGAPGSGKSTLVDEIALRIRAEGERVAVLAVDPTSPISGGAVLGDRLRMQDHATDPGVFVRSMATRGALGGLAPATAGAAQVLACAGWPVVLIETVGVGQVSVDVSTVAGTTVVVVTPGWGDEVQTEKAGLMEIGDIYVVNKADRPGADQARRDIEAMLDLSPRDKAAWRPPVMMTVGTTGEGLDGLSVAVRKHGSLLTQQEAFTSPAGGGIPPG